MSDLINLIICEPSADVEDSVRFKLPHVAAELLTCEVAQISDFISSQEILMEQLYSFVLKPAPLNPLLASFFARAFGVLVTRKKEQVRSHFGARHRWIHFAHAAGAIFFLYIFESRCISFRWFSPTPFHRVWLVSLATGRLMNSPTLLLYTGPVYRVIWPGRKDNCFRFKGPGAGIKLELHSTSWPFSERLNH